jgi:cell wall-associated NlpC family hydrolase
MNGRRLATLTATAGVAAGGSVLALVVLCLVALSPGHSVAAGADCGAPTRAAGPVRLDGEQAGNARAVVEAARDLRAPAQAAAIALMTAMQESSLRNVQHGDAAGPDSRGLFQQRPAFYPGVNVLDPAQASTAFLRRLLALPGWRTEPMWQAAQAVQRSADGHRYARWSAFGIQLATELYGNADASAGRCDVGTAAVTPGKVRLVLATADAQLGRPYVWGGGDARGPTGGVSATVPPGFDCSGLVVYAYAQAGVDLPHSSRALYDVGQRVPLAQARPGDLLFLSNDGQPGGIHHVAMLTSPGRIIEAQDFGVPVHVRAFAGVSEPQIMPYAVRVIP